VVSEHCVLPELVTVQVSVAQVGGLLPPTHPVTTSLVAGRLPEEKYRFFIAAVRSFKATAFVFVESVNGICALP